MGAGERSSNTAMLELRSNLVTLILGLTLGSTILFADDWPQWRGPTRDGQSRDSLPVQLPSAPTVIWKLALAHGYSSPLITSNRVVVLDDADNQETAHGIEASTGQKLWSSPLGENYRDEFEPGPRCTPVMDGDHVYAQTTKGEFRCLRLSDGTTVWRTNFTDLGMVWNSEPNTGIGAANRRGNTGSPVVYGNKIIVQVGSTQGASIVAFDKMTGRILWKSQNDLTTYSSPHLGTLAGRPHFVSVTCEGMLALAPEDGSVLWRIPFKTAANRNVLTPLILDNTVYFASHSTGMRAIRVSMDSGKIQALEIWLNPELKINLSSPVAVGGFLFGQGPTKNYICIDRTSGKICWSQSGFGDVASTICSGSRLLVLTDVGELRLLASNPEKYEELGRLQVCGKTYAHPAFANGVLYARDSRGLQAIGLR